MKLSAGLQIQITIWYSEKSVKLHGENLAGEGWCEYVWFAGESAVGDDREAGDAADEVSQGEADEERSAVVVEAAGPA